MGCPFEYPINALPPCMYLCFFPFSLFFNGIWYLKLIARFSIYLLSVNWTEDETLIVISSGDFVIKINQESDLCLLSNLKSWIFKWAGLSMRIHYTLIEGKKVMRRNLDWTGNFIKLVKFYTPGGSSEGINDGWGILARNCKCTNNWKILESRVQKWSFWAPRWAIIWIL